MKGSFNLICVSLISCIYITSVNASDLQNVTIDSVGRLYMRNCNQSCNHCNSIDIIGLSGNGKHNNMAVDISKNCSIITVSLNGNGNMVAVGIYCESKSNSISSTSHRLTIYETETGKKIASFDNGWSFSFSPKGDRIVYAEELIMERGSKIPDTYQGGIWIYDFNSGKREQIMRGQFRNIDLIWSEHDGNIYYQCMECSQQRLRYNISKNAIETIPYNGIYFSKDGEYYASSSGMEGTKIYTTSSNNEMTELEIKIQKLAKSNHNDIRFRGWCYENILIVAVENDWRNIIINMNDGSIIGEFIGLINGFNKDGSIVSVFPVVKAKNGTKINKSQLNFIEIKNYIKK